MNLSVDDLASKFGCSRRHLSLLFHSHFGISVAALRMEIRLLKAISLLRDPEAKVINIAEDCGFNHLGLFNTCFKRRFGANPRQWRKSNMAPPSPEAPKVAANGNGHSTCPLKVGGLCPLNGAEQPKLNGHLNGHGEKFSGNDPFIRTKPIANPEIMGVMAKIAGARTLRAGGNRP